MHKPGVYRHPHHGKRALQINLGGELGTAMGLLNRLLKQHYTGPKWALHRYAWDHAFMHDLFRGPSSACRWPSRIQRWWASGSGSR